MKLYLLVLFFLLNVKAFSGDYIVQNIPVDQSGNPNNVFYMRQDKEGFIWFATNKAGIYRYDGHNIKYFSSKEGFANNNVKCIYQDKQNDLWVGTADAGLFKFDGKAFHRFNSPGSPKYIRSIIDNDGYYWIISNKDFLRFDGHSFIKLKSFNTTIVSIKNDFKGNIWILLQNSELYRFDKHSFQLENLNTKDKIHSLFFDKQGNMLLGLDNKLLKISNGKRIEIVPDGSLKPENFRDIMEDQSGNLWFFGKGSLYKYNGITTKRIEISKWETENPCFSILEDFEHTIWVGTKNNILKLKENSFTFLDDVNTDLLRYNFIMEDRKGRQWFARTKGYAILDNGKLKIYPMPEDSLSLAGASGIEDDAHNYWFAKENCLVKYDGHNFTKYPFKEKALTHKNLIKEMKIGSDGCLYINYNNRQIVKFDGHNFSHYQFAINSHEFFELFSGIFNRHLVYSRENSVLLLDRNKYSKIDIAVDAIGIRIPILEDSEYIWIVENITSGSSALIGISKKTGKRTRLSEKDGLMTGKITSYIADKEGNLWFSNIHKGISKFDVNEFYRSGKVIFINYTIIGDWNNLVPRFDHLDNHGNIWVKMVNGWTKFNPKDFSGSAVSAPKIILSGIKLFYGNHDLSNFADKINIDGIPNNLDLPYYENHISFEYSALSYTDPENIRYASKLEGFDNQWSPFLRINEITYPNLPPGKYTFKVIAKSKDDQKSHEAAVFSFIVRPPFWRTWWFLLLAIVIIVSITVILIKSRTHKIRRQKKVLEELVDLRTMELQEEKERVESINSELEKSRYQLAKINELQNEWLATLSESEFQLQETNENKDQLISMISHDLKSPFYALISYTDIMLEEYETLSKQQFRDYTVALNKSARNLYNLIEDLLDWSRIQTGKIDFQPTDYDISVQIKEIIYLHSGSLLKKNVSLLNKVIDPIFVYADPRMIKSVIHNLVANAVKFTNSGGTIIISHIVLETEVEVSVSDNGVGMTPEILVKLFKINIKHTTPGTFGETGTGLGLILCKELVEKNGGSIRVESKFCSGSIFRFSLPRERPPENSE